MKTIKPNNYKIIVGTYQYDIGNVCQGYFLTKYIGECTRKKKLTVEKDGKKLIYDIYNTEIIPLQFGSGQYTITGYENIIAKKKLYVLLNHTQRRSLHKMIRIWARYFSFIEVLIIKS